LLKKKGRRKTKVEREGKKGRDEAFERIQIRSSSMAYIINSA